MTQIAIKKTPTSNSQLFETEHLKVDLKGRCVRGGAVTILGQSARFVIQMGSTAVLARVLTPQDFGLIAMVTAVTGFTALFKDLGLSMATVQKAEVTHEQISVLFWVNVGVSFVIALVTAALAPVIAWFYGEPRLTSVSIALSLVFILGGLTVQHQALLRRQMQFTALATIQVLSMLAGVVAAIVAAALGASYWALVVMHLVGSLTNAVAVWIASPWWPGLAKKRAGVRKMLAFGGNLTGYNALNYFARNLDNILIGWYWGAGPLGFYSKAYSLLMLPIQQIRTPISSVAIPALSRLQDDPERYQHYYYRVVNMIAFVSMPLAVVMAALSDEIIRIVLGEQWVSAASIFKALAFMALLQPVSGTTGCIFISLGQTNRMMRWALVKVPLNAVAFIIGLPWGPIGVAIAYLFYSLLLFIPNLLVAFRYSPVDLAGFFRAVRCPLAVSLIMYTALELTQRYFLPGLSNSVFTLLYSCMAGLLALIAAIAVWPEARREALDALKVVKMLRRRTSTA